MADVLLVDDNDELRQNIAEILEAEGFAVCEATDGETALRVLLDPAAALPAVVVVDLRMAHMDGVAFLRVKALIPRVSRLPVIVVSAFCGDARGLPGAERMLEKPVDIRTLVAQVRDCCAAA